MAYTDDSQEFAYGAFVVTLSTFKEEGCGFPV